MNPYTLETKDLYKTYHMGKAVDVNVLKGVDLVVNKGEIVTIYGPSGVGKSTLLHIMGTLDRPSRGSVRIDGEDVFKYSDLKLAKFRNQAIGFIFQFHHLLPEFTALENVMMPGMIAGHKSSDLKNKSLALLKQVGLSERVHHRPRELSGGEQQRIAVARALVNNPKLVLADEPSGNLDIHTAESLHTLLHTISRKLEQTIIIVTHNRELTKISDRIIELYDGKIKSNIVA